MTAEHGAIHLSPSLLGPLTFLAELSPLPLVGPTEAAAYLGVERHTLACYRSLGDGPAYYKFGRWIRYALADLQAWRAGSVITAMLPLGEVGHETGLVEVGVAARYLTVTPFCLRNYRIEGLGPRFCRFGRRLHYLVQELRDWAECQRHAPVCGRSRQTPTAASPG